MTFYSLTIPGQHQVALASFSNRSKVFSSIEYILKNFKSVEFIGIFDFDKKKKVNHKNISIAISLLNENESFGLKFISDTNVEFFVDITKMKMNPEHQSILLPLMKFN